MKRTIFALLILTLFLAGCSGPTQPTYEVYDGPEASSSNRPIVIDSGTSTSPMEVFPKAIGTYTKIEEKNEPVRCQTFEKDTTDVEGNTLGIEGQMCSGATMLRYLDESTNRIMFVRLIKFTEGEELMKNLLMDIYPEVYPGLIEPLEGVNVYRMEKHELFWFTDSKTFDEVSIQYGQRSPRADGGASYSYPYTANLDNEVTQYFIKLYPPTS